MTTIQVAKVNITMNLLKIASVWGASILLVYNIGRYADKIETKMIMVTDHEVRIKDLEKWREKVTAYYTPKNR